MKLILKVSAGLFGCLLSLSALAQNTMPETDIFLVDMKVLKGKYVFGTPQNITRRPGYDNQPSFLPGGKQLIYVSILTGRRSDVYRYDIVTGKSEQITETPFDEYSPELEPDGKNVSVVCVEEDSTQRLWQFPQKGGDFSLLLPDQKNIGYYCWAGKNVLALYVLGKPDMLQIMDIRNNTLDTVANHIGRCIHSMHDGNAITYVDKSTDEAWYIVKLSLSDYSKDTLAQTLPGVEDYTITSKGVLLSGKEGKLYRFDPKRDKEWIRIADFSNTEVKDFYRIVISPKGDHLALVSFSGKRP